MSNKETMQRKMNLVFTDDEIKRVTYAAYCTVGEGSISDNVEVIADVHGMSPHCAKRFLSNIISLERNPFSLVVIHGSNHGTAIKDMLWTEGLGKRAMGQYKVEGNEGRTRFNIADALSA